MALTIQVPQRVLRRPIGLGDILKRITTAFGVGPCGACLERAQKLNAAVVIGPRMLAMGGQSGCNTVKGSCTGFGTRQCVTGPARVEPDSELIEQCCSGWFQYPWITICPGRESQRGCGVCLW